MPRKKLKRFAEIKTFSNVFENEEGKKMKGKWRKDFFENKNPLVLEIGCGHGVYTLALAARFPDKNFIGIDKKGERIWRGAKNAINEKRSNCVFLKIYIEHLPEYFKKKEVDEIWVTFPDPYPKPSRSQRRLTSARFLKLYKEILKDGAFIHIKTDNLPLFEFSLQSAKEEKFIIEKELRDIHGQKNIAENEKNFPEIIGIKTVFEKRYFSLGKPIYYARLRK